MQFFKYFAAIGGFSFAGMAGSFGATGSPQITIYESQGVDPSVGSTAVSNYLANAVKVIETEKTTGSQIPPVEFQDEAEIAPVQLIATPGIPSWNGNFLPTMPFQGEQGEAVWFFVDVQRTTPIQLALTGNSLSVTASDFGIQSSVSFTGSSTFNGTTAWGIDWAPANKAGVADTTPITSGNGSVDEIIYALPVFEDATISDYQSELAYLDSGSVTGFNVDASYAPATGTGASLDEFVALDIPAVPEPPALALFASGFLALFLCRKRAKTPRSR